MMLSPDIQKAIGAVTNQLRIIIGALLFGVTAYVVFASVQAAPVERPERSISLIAAGMAAACAALSVVVPRIIGAQQRQELANRKSPPANASAEAQAAEDAGPLLMGYQTRRIIAAAILEGGAFFNAYVYQTERLPLTLALLVVLLAGLATLFPFRGLVEQWLEGELRTVREMRQLRQ
jgi:hypothetical protein